MMTDAMAVVRWCLKWNDFRMQQWRHDTRGDGKWWGKRANINNTKEEEEEEKRGGGGDDGDDAAFLIVTMTKKSFRHR